MVFPHKGGVELFFGRVDPILSDFFRICIIISRGGDGGGGRGRMLIGTERRGC